MKKIFFFLLLAGYHAVLAQKAWTGAVSTDWNDAGNWDAGVPTSSDNVFIDACTTCPKLNSNVSIGNLHLNWDSKIDLDGKTATVWMLTSTGATIFAAGGTIDAYRTGGYQNNTVKGNFTLKINRNGTDDYLGAQVGANSYENDFTLECNTGNSTTYGIANQYGDVYSGKTILKNTGKGWLMIASNSTSAAFFKDEVELVNANTDEGKIQVGVFGGRMECDKFAKITDNSTSPYSYITVVEGLFKDEVEIRSNTAYIGIGAQNSTVFKKKVTLFNHYNASFAFGSASGNVTFEKTADLVIDPSTPMNRGSLFLQWCDFQGDETTVNQTINLRLGEVEGATTPNTFIKLGYYGYFAKHVNLRADYIEFNRVNFYGDVEMERTGATTNLPSGFIGWGICPGNCQFWGGTTTFKNTYGDDWILQAYNSDMFKYNVKFIQGKHPWGVLRASYSGSTTYEGNLEVKMPSDSYNGIIWGENGGTTTLSANKTLTVPEFGNGWMALCNFYQIGNTTPTTLNMNGASLGFYSSDFQSPLTVTTGRLTLSGSTFFDSFFTKYGNGSDYSAGGNIFKKKVRIKNQATTGEFKFVYQNSTVVNP